MNVEAMKDSVVKDEGAALAKEKAALEHEDVMSVRLERASDELNVLTHTRDEVDSQLKEFLTLTHDQREKLERLEESDVMKKKELEELKIRLPILEEEFRELTDGNESTFSYARLAARAAIMRRYLSGKDPLSLAKEQLDVFLNGIGTERDLDLEDERNAEMEAANENLLGEAPNENTAEFPLLP